MSQDAIVSFQGEYRFLSNFWPCQIHIHLNDDTVYPSAEHAYQAQKSLSQQTRRVLALEATAGRAKRLGKTLKWRLDWHEVRLAVMQHVVDEKFDQNRDLAELLIATGGRDLIEGNSWGDRFWGKVDGQDRLLEGMIGQNWLGRILTITRSRLVWDN